MGAVELVVSIILVSLSYSIAVSLLVPYFPGVESSQLAIFTDGQDVSKVTTLKSGLEDGMIAQTTIPFLDFGTLVFYSSVTAVNLFLNALTAVPQMLGILFNGLLLIIKVPATVANVARIGFLGIATVIFYLSMFVFLISTRVPTGGGLR